MGDYVLRPATAGDAAVLASQRRAMFAAMGQLTPGDADALEAAARAAIARAMQTGSFYAWLVEWNGEAVAGGGVQLRPLMPRPGYVRGEPEALVLSMWTAPAHRRRRLARRVLEAILAWCRERGIRRVTLHASSQGRALYEQYGFAPTNEMRLELEQGEGVPCDAQQG